MLARFIMIASEGWTGARGCAVGLLGVDERSGSDRRSNQPRGPSEAGFSEAGVRESCKVNRLLSFGMMP